MKILPTMFLLFAVPAFGVGLRDVPQLPESGYTASSRDPFVDASVSPTILGATGERDLRNLAPPIETYTREIEALLQQSSRVNGIAVSDGMSLSVVNGKMVKPGESLTIILPDELGQRLLATSRYYGLGLEPQIESKILRIEVSGISKNGLSLNLRGMNLHLHYRKDLSPH